MLRERTKLITQAHKVWDICLTAAAFIAAYFIKLYLLPASFRGLTIAPNYYIVLLMIIIIWYLTFTLFDLYASYRQQTLDQILWNMIKAVSTGMLVMFLCMYIFKITDVSRIMIGIFFLLNIVLLTLSKGTAYRILAHYRQRGFNFRNVLIVGSRERDKDVINAIGDQLGSGFRVLGCLELDKGATGQKVGNGIEVIGTVDDLEKTLCEEVVDELIFAMPLKMIQKVDKYISVAEDMGVSVRIIPDWQLHKQMYHPEIANIKFEEFLGLPTLALTSTPPNQGELLIKSVFDYIFASIALILSLPIFSFVGAGLKLVSRGPIFFKQERCGLNGRKFVVYKFRTMVAGCRGKT